MNKTTLVVLFEELKERSNTLKIMQIEHIAKRDYLLEMQEKVKEEETALEKETNKLEDYLAETTALIRIYEKEVKKIGIEPPAWVEDNLKRLSDWKKEIQTKS